MSQSPAPTVSPHNDDWRESVAQSTRSAEVRAVADVLAKMEHGATASSKLMLAMRFENEIFNKATSLADYQKRIQKRLKKFTKTYQPTAPSPLPDATHNEERLLQLKRIYGERLQFIVDHADKAIRVILNKNEPEKAKGLKQHTDNVKVWATNLGVLEGTTINTGMDAAAIEEMASLLERRVDNIRNHVLKLANMDLLLQETLQKLEHDLTDTASQLMAAVTLHRVAQLQWTDLQNPIQALQDNLTKAQASIAPPTRNKESQRQAALSHLERMRAACQAILAFLAVPDKHAIPQSNVLVKCHATAMQTLDFIASVMPELVPLNKRDKTAQQKQQVTLEDAWTKIMEYPTPDMEASPSGKRIKMTPVLSSRVLLTPGRKTPSNLLPELKRKGARLVRPPPNGEGSHLIVEFDNVLVMTIYLVPLLVTIRAAKTTNTTTTTTTKFSDNLGCATWTPVQSGLDECVELHIWGTTGTPATLGHVVQGQLDYASARATTVLRKYFSNIGIAKNDFEVEISEGTALLQFLQLARTTYTPHFQDPTISVE